MKVGPVVFKVAAEFIALHHRHHKPPLSHRFSLGLWEGEVLVGVACIGRPVSRVLQARGHLEITRLCCLDVRNAASCLLAACVRASRAWVHAEQKRRREQGDEPYPKGCRLITYTLQSESGASLRAAGFERDVVSADSSSVRGRKWEKGKVTGRCALGPKVRWSKAL